MTPIPYLFFMFSFTIAGNSGSEEINTAIALKAAKDNPVLLKILQTVDAATNNERLFNVTLNLLKSLCICMRETLRKKQLECFQPSREMKSLQTDDVIESNRKVLDIYQKIYNKTCFDLREELAMKVNKSENLTPEEERDFMDHSNCGKKAVDENTEDYERLTSQLTQVVENKSNLKKILHTIFVTTRNYHKFHMRKFNLFKNSQKSTQHSAKHSIIVILTFYPHQNGTQLSDNLTEVSSDELNTTLFLPSPIDIDVIDTRYSRKENSRDDDFILKPATDCSLKSIYGFLLQSEQVNETKVFKILRKKGTIKVYIDIPTQINQIDYSKVCCINATEIPLCKTEFSRENFDSHEITTYLPEFKKRKKLYGDYKNTISKIKTLVKLYDRKLNGNNLNQLNLKTIKNNSKFNKIMTSVGKNVQAVEKDKGNYVILSKDKYFKLPFKTKFDDSDPVTESATVNNYLKKQYVTEKHNLINFNSSNESGMNTVSENIDSVGTKDLVRTTLHDEQNRSVLLNEDIKVTNITKLISSTKTPLSASKEHHIKLTTSVENGLEENIDTKATYGNDSKSSIFKSYQNLQNDIVYDHFTTEYHSYATEETYPTLKNNKFKTETEVDSIQNTVTENLAIYSSRNTTAVVLTEMFSNNANVNNNTIDYSDSAKLLKHTGKYPNQRGHNKNIRELSIKSKNNYQISNAIKITQNIKENYNTESFDLTNAMTTDRNTNNENSEVTSERINEREVETRTHKINNEILPSPLLISTDKYFNMQQNQFKVTDIMNKTLARNHNESNNYFRVKESTSSTMDYWNTSTSSNSSNMGTVTTSLKKIDSNFMRKKIISSIAIHNDDNNLKPLVSSDQINSQLTALKGSMLKKMNFQNTKDQLFHNSAKTTIPLIIINNDVQEKSSLTRRPDQIKITKNLKMMQQYNNKFDSIESPEIITSTNNQSQTSLTQTTNMNFQLLQPELDNTVIKINNKSDNLNATDILSNIIQKSTVSNIQPRDNITRHIESTYFDDTYVTEGTAKILNTTNKKYFEKNTFETFSHGNRNPKDIADDIGDTTADTIKSGSNTKATDNKPEITVSRKAKKKTETNKTLSTYFPRSSKNVKYSYDAPAPKTNKLMSSENIILADTKKAPASVIPYLKMKKTAKALEVSAFENNIKPLRMKNKTNVLEDLFKVTTKPYSDHKYYEPNIETTLIDIVKKNSHFDPEETYSSALSKTSTFVTLSYNRKELDKFMPLNTTVSSRSDINISSDLTTTRSQFKFKTSKQPHKNIDSFAIIGDFQSSKEFSGDAGDAKYNITEDDNNYLKATVLSNKEQLLNSQDLTIQPEVTHFSKDTHALSANNLLESVKNTSMISMQQAKSDSLSKTSKLNDTTKRPTGIVATDIIGNIQRGFNLLLSDIKQYSPKANESRITRSTRAIKNPIDTYNQISTLSNTVPFSDSLVISYSTSALQDLDKSNIKKAFKSPARSKNFKVTSERTGSQSSATMDLNVNKANTEVILTPRTVKYQSISGNDHKITTYIISPTVIQDTDTKKSIAELNNFTNFEALNKNSDERNDMKNIYNIVKATILTDPTYIDKPHEFTVKEPQETRSIDIMELNYLTTDENSNEYTEIRDAVVSHLKTNLPQSITYDANDTPSEAPDDVKYKEKKLAKDSELAKKKYDPEIRPTATNKYVRVSLEPSSEKPIETQLIQSLKMLNLSDGQNNSKSSSFERKNSGVDLDAPSSLYDVNNDFKNIMEFLNESSHTTSTAAHNILISSTQASQSHNLTNTQLQPDSWIFFKENMPQNTTASSKQERNKNDTLIISRDNTKNINIHNLSPATELINNFDTISDITKKLLKISKQPTFEETQTDAFLKIANPKKFYKFEYLTQPITPMSTLVPFSSTNKEQNNVKSIETEENSFTIPISPKNQDDEIEEDFSNAKTSRFGDYLKVTAPNFTKREQAKEISSDSDVSFDFIKQNIPVFEAITSRLERTEKNRYSVTKPQLTLKPQQVEVLKPPENIKTLNITKLTRPNKDLNYSHFIDSLVSSKEKYRASVQDFKVFSITNIPSTKCMSEAHNVAIITPQPHATDNNLRPQNIKTILQNSRLPYLKNDSKLGTPKDDADSNNAKMDEFTKYEEHKDSFKPMTDFDKYETLKIINPTPFQDNVNNKSNVLHNNLNTKEYNFTAYKTAFSTPPGNTILFRLSDLPISTKDDIAIISKILKPSTLLSHQYNVIKTSNLGVAQISFSSIKNLTQMQKANETSYDPATQIYESFEIQKEKRNNEVKNSAEVAGNEIHKDPLNDLLITNFYKTKMSNGLEITEKEKNIGIKKDIFEDILETKKEPSLYTTQTNKNIKTGLVTLTVRPHYFQVTKFSSTTGDNLDAVSVLSNVLKTSNTPKHYTVQPNGFAVNELLLKITKSDTKNRNANTTAQTDLMSIKNDSFGIKKEIYAISNNVPSSHVTIYISARNKTRESSPENLLAADTNKNYALKHLLSTFVNANSNVVNNKEEITKKTKWHSLATGDNLRTTQYASSKNETDLETFSITPNYFEMSDNLSYTGGNFEDNNIISNVEKSSIILNQQQADVFDDLARTESLSKSGRFYIETHHTNITSSRDRVKRMNETFKTTKYITGIHNVLNPNDVTVGNLTDNDLHEIPYKELFITNTDRPKTLNAFESVLLINNIDTKSGILNNYLDITEVPSFDATLMGRVLRTKYYNLLEKEAAFTTPNESRFFTQTTESSTFIGNKHGENVTLSNDVNTSYFSSPQDAGISRNLKVPKLHSSKYEKNNNYENGIQNTIKTTLKGQNAFLTDKIKVVEETTPFNKILAFNNEAVGNLSENEIQKLMKSRSDLITHLYESQTESEPTKESSKFETKPGIIDVPLTISKESNFDEAQTEAIVKYLRSKEYKILGSFTESTTPTDNFKVVKSSKIQDKTKSEEETFYFTDSVTVNSLEDQQKDVIITHNFTETQNTNNTLTTDKISQLDDHFISTEKSTEIYNITPSHNEIVNDMAKNKTHEESSHPLSIASLIDPELHKDLESAVVTRTVDDQPNITNNYIKITANASFDKMQAVSFITNLSPKPYNSLLLVTESTRQTKNPKYLENTTFAEIPFNWSVEETVKFKENEHVKRIFNKAKTSSFLNPNYRDKVSYAVTDSLLDSFIRHNELTDTIVPLNNKFMFKKENTENSNIGTTNEMLVYNLAENEIQNTLSSVLRITELDKSETIKDLYPAKIYDRFDTLFNVTVQAITLTEKPRLYETQKVETPDNYNLFQYPRKLTTSKNAITMNDNRNNTETTIMEQTYNSQGNLNFSKLNVDATSSFFNQIYNYSDVIEHNTEAYKTNFKLSNARNAHLYENLQNTTNVTKTDDTEALVEEVDKTPKVKYTKLTASPFLNVTQTVQFLSVTEQNNTGILPGLISDLTLSKNDIVNGFNLNKKSNISNYHHRSQKQNLTIYNDVDTRVDSRIKKESVEIINDMLAIIETATDSYNHVLDDLTFHDTTNIDYVTDVTLSKNQTGLGVQFTIFGNKTHGQNETATKMLTSVLPHEGKLLENQAIKMKDNLSVITPSNVSKKSEISLKSSSETDQRNTAATSGFNVNTEKDRVSSEFIETLNSISTTTFNEPSKKKKSLDIWLPSKLLHSMEISKTGSDHPEYFNNLYLEKITDKKTIAQVSKIEDKNFASYDAAYDAIHDDNFQLMNESSMSTEKKPTTVHELEINTRYGKKNNTDKNVLTDTTEKDMSEANVTAIVNNKKKFLNKMRSSYDREFNYPNELRENAENYYFTGTTPLSDTEPYLTDTKIVFDGTENNPPTLLEHYPVTYTDRTNQPQSKTAYVIRSTRHSEIKLEEINIFSDSKINTSENNTKDLTPITDISSDKSSKDKNLTDIQYNVYPVSSKIYNTATADHFNKFEGTIKSTRLLMPNTKIPSINEYFLFDHTRPEANSNYENNETSTSTLDKQDSFVSKTNKFNLIQNKTVSQKTHTPSHFEQQKIMLFDVDTVSPENRNVTNITEYSENLRGQEVTELLLKYTEHSSERQLQNSGNKNEYVKEVESNSITIAPRTTPMKFVMDEIFTKYKAETKTHPESIEDYFVTSTTIVPTVKGNLTIPAHMETLVGTEDVENEIKFTTVTDSINSFSTLSMINENIITKRNTKPNSVNELTLSPGKTSAIDGGAMLFNMPPLAFHLTDLKLELLPTYSNNKPQIIPKLHGKFNISLSMESQHVTNSMDHNNTLDVLNKAFVDQLHSTKSAVKPTYGSNFEKRKSAMKKYIGNAHEIKTDHFLSKLVKYKKDFLSNSISSTSESQIVKYFLATNDTFWHDSKNMSNEKRDQNKQFSTPEIQKYRDLIMSTVTDTEQEENTSLLLQLNTNLNTHLKTSSRLPNQNSITDPYTFYSNFNKSNIVADIYKLNNTTLSNSTNQIYNKGKALNNDTMTNINLTKSAETSIIFENMETELKKNLTRISQSRRYGDETVNLFSKSNKDLVNITENKLMDNNTLDNREMIDNNTIVTKVESNLNKTYIGTAVKRLYNENPLSNMSSLIDGSEPNSNFVPITSKLSHIVDIMTTTEIGILSESAMSNQNKASLVNAYDQTNVPNPSDVKNSSIETTANTSALPESKPDKSSAIYCNKRNNNLLPIITKPLKDVGRMIITKKEDLPESAMLNQNKTLFVNEYNKTNVNNPADIKKGSTTTTAKTSKFLELKPYTLTPIVFNTVLTVDKINKNNCKSHPNKNAKIAEKTSTCKEQTSNTQSIELKSEVEKSSINASKSKNLPNIRKAYDAITLSELNTKRNIHPSVTSQTTDTLTSVDLNVMQTPAGQNARIKDKKKHLIKLHKKQNSKPKLLKPKDVKKENNFRYSTTLTGKTEHDLDSKVKNEKFSLNHHVTSKSLLRTTRKIKYNTYRPLTEEELDPSELHKIISSFPKYDTKKVKTKNPQQVKNYHSPSGNKSKYNTNQHLHNKSNIFDPLDKKNIYPVKKIISNPRKIIKRLKLANKRNDIITMKTEDFFSRRLGVTQKDKIGDILKLYPKPVLKLRPVTTKPRSVILRPKFSSLNTFTKKPAIKKPVIMQNMDIDYYRSLTPQYRRIGPIRSKGVNNIPGKLEVPPRIGFGDPVIDAPYYIPTIMKPKFFRDRVNSIRSYIYNVEKKPNYRRHFLNHPGEAEDDDDSFVQYSKGNSREEEDINTPVHRFTRPKKTIFFLSPTVPYNRYF